MLSIFKRMKPREGLIILLAVVFIIIQVNLDLTLPDYMSEITTLVKTEGSEMSAVLTAGGKMLLCALGSLCCAVFVGFLAAQVASRFSMGLREQVYNRVMAFSHQEINQFSTASLITRSTNDITQIQLFLAMGMQVIIKAPIMGILAVRKISSISWEWSLLTGCVILFVVGILCFIMVFAIPRFTKIQGLTDNLNRVTRENLTGLLVVRAYNGEAYQEEKFDRANSALTRNNLQAFTAMSILNPGLNLSMNGLTLGIYWIGAVLIGNVALTGVEGAMERLSLFSNMVVFSSYAMQVIMAFLMLVIIFLMLPRAAVSAKRINEVLNTPVHIQSGTHKGGGEQQGEITFRNVSFRYPDAMGDVLHNISFTAHRGETVAIIGATGCGKTTLINLIPRLYDATQGEVLIDGVNVKEYALDALREKIGFVPQKAYLFSGTVESNVAYGSVAENATLQEAIAIAQAEEFVRTVTLQGEVSQGGSNFSGGQKQRLSIARAVAKGPEILVFDDSFSALDYKTDRALRHALREKTAGTTTIIVAQRIGTIRDADRILVLEDGAIVGSGTHQELMQSCTVYREIAYSQLSKEELAS